MKISLQMASIIHYVSWADNENNDGTEYFTGSGLIVLLLHSTADLLFKWVGEESGSCRWELEIVMNFFIQLYVLECH